MQGFKVKGRLRGRISRTCPRCGQPMVSSSVVVAHATTCKGNTGGTSKNQATKKKQKKRR